MRYESNGVTQPPTLTLEREILPLGGALRCRTQYGCGVGVKSKRQPAINTTRDDSYELNDNEKLLFSVSDVGLLWRASFGQFSAGIDEAKFEVKNVYAVKISFCTALLCDFYYVLLLLLIF